MSLPRDVADILGQRVKREIESIGQISLNVYLPRTQSARGMVNIFRVH